jgi:hypothetical protein
MKNKILMLCGILAPILYVATVILGGLLRPGYSHIAQPVSDLIATGAPNKALLDSLLAFYNLFAFGFGIGLYMWVRAENLSHGKAAGTVGAIALIAEGIFGFATIFFPEDLGGMGAQISSTGTIHIILASLSSLTTMLAILLMGFWFKNIPPLKGYSLYSFISVGVVFVSGGLAAATIAAQLPIGGLLERITIGGFLQWLLGVAWKAYSS